MRYTAFLSLALLFLAPTPGLGDDCSDPLWIPDEGLRFEIKDESWFPDHELQRSGPVLAIVVLKRNGVDRVLLEGEIKTTLAFDCDRCLENYSMDLDSSFKLDLDALSNELIVVEADVD